MKVFGLCDEGCCLDFVHSQISRQAIVIRPATHGDSRGNIPGVKSVLIVLSAGHLHRQHGVVPLRQSPGEWLVFWTLLSKVQTLEVDIFTFGCNGYR